MPAMMERLGCSTFWGELPGVRLLNWIDPIFQNFWCARRLGFSTVTFRWFLEILSPSIGGVMFSEIQRRAAKCFFQKGRALRNRKNPRKLLHDWFISWPLSKVYGGFLRWFPKMGDPQSSESSPWLSMSFKSQQSWSDCRALPSESMRRFFVCSQIFQLKPSL